MLSTQKNRKNVSDQNMVHVSTQGSHETSSLWALPRVRGKYYFNYPLSKITWFHVGGLAQVLFKPEDEKDLSVFLQKRDPHMPIYVLGAGSNVLIRDGGLKGCVIKLGKGFSKIQQDDCEIIIGAACLDRTAVLYCADNGLSGLEFLIGVPGSIGGAIAMNAGAYGYEVKDRIKWVEVLKPDGTFLCLDKKDLTMSYRCGNLPRHAIVTRACFKMEMKDKASIDQKIKDYLLRRQETQPIVGHTGGSTFKNPQNDPRKAWELIDFAECRGLKKRGAEMSQKHCNFMLNVDHASAKDLESLGEEVRQKVFEKTGILLEWEIIRLGDEVL